ncbi:MAG: DUF4351 domain-containing protein [Alphaproteobacteria bacterium]|nr:DUF4351 domain-containing protein [Alphaproteobacteria bacterium]
MPAFLAFFFPAAHAAIDWTKGYTFLDQELQAVVQDAELGRRYVDKLVRVTLLGGEDAWILVHIEVQGTREAGLAERIFVYNYRIFDRHRRPVASLVVLADESPGWKPSSFGFDALGCRHSIDFPTVKLLDYAGREDDLLKDDNPFALVTVAHLLTRATRNDMAARYAAKWKLVRLLYERGWDRQRVIDLFTVIDWLMRLPADLNRDLWLEIERLEGRSAMRYVTSVERIGIEKGRSEGKAEMLLRQIRRRFGSVPAETEDRVRAAGSDQLDEWMDRLMDARDVADVFGPSTH